MSAIEMVDMQEVSVEDTTLFQFPAFNRVDRFIHAVTSKPWNMATHCGPARDLAVPRRRRVCDFLGLSFDRLTAAEQIHSPHVLRIQPSDIGAGRDGRHNALRFVDGMICDTPGVALMQFSADCPMIVLIESERGIIGTAHASWRGTVAQITAELLRQMRTVLRVDPSALVAGICPCAGPAEYEIGEDVRRIALGMLPNAERFFSRSGASWRFDMRAANVDQLVRGGVDPKRISVASPCTLSDSRFYSYRREGADTGRFALIAAFSP